MRYHSLFRNGSAATLALATFLAATPGHVQVQTYAFNIPSQDLDGALRRFAKTTRQQIIFRGDEVRGKRSTEVSGSQSAQAALEHMLTGTGLAFSVNGRGVFVVSSPRADLQPVDASPDQQSAEIVVTGTHIRGSESASPTITIGQKQFREEGFSDLGDVIRDVPQNFRGGQNPGITYGTGGATNVNATGGSSLNLRGLGPDATLTLLNGRRLGFDANYQTVDISAIPIEAVDRLEIVPDGASAIYGSDAVGGVANVILRRDFEGLTVGTRQGGATDGGLATHEYTATGGTRWGSGGFIATFKKSKQDPIFSDQRDYTQAMYGPTTLYTASDLTSGLFSGHQSIGDMVDLGLDGLYTKRDSTAYRGFSNFYYKIPTRTNIGTLAPSIKAKLPSNWSVSLAGTYSVDNDRSNSTMVRNGVSTTSSSSHYDSKVRSVEAEAEGPLFRFDQREIRLAVGIGARESSIAVHYDDNSSPDVNAKQKNWYIFGEIQAPIFSDADAISGIRRLEIDVAVRSEDYNSFSRVTTPKFGIIYAPVRDITIKGSWGRSFKAPTLSQLYGYRAAYLFPAGSVGCSSCIANQSALVLAGTNPNLQPERARTWSATMDFHPQAIQGFNLELSYFNISYNQRVITPITNLQNALSNVSYAQFVQYNPSLILQQASINSFGGLTNFTGSDYDPNNVVALISDQSTNVAAQNASGFDLNGNYQFKLGGGTMEIRGAGSWLSLSQRNTSSQPETKLSGTIFYPAHFNARFGGSWSYGGFVTSAFVNHVSGVYNNLTTPTSKIDSFTTADATLSYQTPAERGFLSRFLVSLNISNIFNKAPPLYAPTNRSYAPFDSTNYSAVGRYITISVSKHF